LLLYCCVAATAGDDKQVFYTVVELSGNVKLWITVYANADGHFSDVIGELVQVRLLEAAEIEEWRHVLRRDNDRRRQ